MPSQHQINEADWVIRAGRNQVESVEKLVVGLVCGGRGPSQTKLDEAEQSTRLESTGYSADQPPAAMWCVYLRFGGKSRGGGGEDGVM